MSNIWTYMLALLFFLSGPVMKGNAEVWQSSLAAGPTTKHTQKYILFLKIARGPSGCPRSSCLKKMSRFSSNCYIIVN